MAAAENGQKRGVSDTGRRKEPPAGASIREGDAPVLRTRPERVMKKLQDER